MDVPYVRRTNLRTHVHVNIRVSVGEVMTFAYLSVGSCVKETRCLLMLLEQCVGTKNKNTTITPFNYCDGHL